MRPGKAKPLVSRRDLYVIEAVLWVAVLWSMAELFGAWRLAVRLFGPTVRRKLDRLSSVERVRVDAVFTPSPTAVRITELYQQQDAGSWRQGAAHSAAAEMQRRMET